MRLAVRDFGTALHFNGGADKVEVPFTFSTSSFTLVHSYKLDRNGLGNFSSNEGWFTSTGSLRYSRQALNTVEMYAYLLATADYATPRRLRFGSLPAPKEDGNWHQRITVVFVDADNHAYCTTYEDGALLQSRKTVNYTGDSSTPTGTFTIGIGNTGYHGSMDDIQVFNDKVFSDSEAADFYFNSTRPQNPDLWIKFNEGSGPTALDSSGNGNDGTITGATYTSDVPMKARRVVPTTPQAALSFTAAGNNVSVPHTAALNLGSSFTVFARIRPTASTGFGRILEKSESSGYSFNIEAGGASNGQITAQINGSIYRSGAAFPPFTASGAASSQWASVAYALSGGTLTFYVNGIALGSATGVPTPSANTSNLIIGNRAALDRTWNGAIKDVSMFNGRALSADEILSLHNNAAIERSSLAGEWLFNEGAGPTASDTSGNANHGAITGATYTRNTPAQPRALVGGSLVLNGDFEYAPPFTAATTAAGRYVDGSASGSTTNTLFGSWALIVTSGFSSAQFDTGVFRSGGASFRLSTTGASGSATAGQGTSTGFPAASEIASALPSTSYTLTAWIKTSNVATNSAFVEAREYAGDGTQTASTASTQLSGTNDWTKTTLVFTTNANTRYIRIFLRNNVAGNISDAWFDDIVLKPTLPVTRALAGERALA